MTPQLLGNERAITLFKVLLDDDALRRSEYALVIVQHVLPNTLPMLLALKDRFRICGIIPKPRSVHQPSLERLEEARIPILWMRRNQLETAEHICRLVEESLGERKLIVMDVGGYFACCLRHLHDRLGDRLLGVVEDTENGQQKYEAGSTRDGPFPCPILSVARSPLKEPEDHLVGQSIVYSVERVLRENDTLLTNKRVLVLGYGKIGKSIAASLSVRNISVWVYDTDPIRRAQALAHGFLTPDRDPAIAAADIIFGATGNKSLGMQDFLGLKKYAFVASVTSADDEFDLGDLRGVLSAHEGQSNVETFYNNDRVFYLINKGNAVNFTWNFQTLGPYIYLVACELIASVRKLVQQAGALPLDRINVLSTDERRDIASHWLGAFGNGGSE